MQRISDVVPDRRKCLLVNAHDRTDTDPAQLTIMCNTWPLVGEDETVLAIEEDEPVGRISQITWERLPNLLDELLARFCSKIELISTSSNGIRLGVMKLSLKRGVTRITMLNWVLEQLRIGAVWNERYTTDEEPSDTGDRINEELKTRFTQLLFGS